MMEKLTRSSNFTRQVFHYIPSVSKLDEQWKRVVSIADKNKYTTSFINKPQDSKQVSLVRSNMRTIFKNAGVNAGYLDTACFIVLSFTRQRMKNFHRHLMIMKERVHAADRSQSYITQSTTVAREMDESKIINKLIVIMNTCSKSKHGSVFYVNAMMSYIQPSMFIA